MTKTIYVVCGSTGAYSDRMEWVAKAFANKDKAEQLALNAERWVLKRIKESKSKWSVDCEDNPYDPRCMCHSEYDGICYWVTEVNFDSAD